MRKTWNAIPSPLLQDFLLGSGQQEAGDFQILVGGRTENFLTAAGFHGHELSVLVKIHATGIVEMLLKFQ